MGRHWTFWLGLALPVVAVAVLAAGAVLGRRTSPTAISLLLVGLLLVATSDLWGPPNAAP